MRSLNTNLVSSGYPKRFRSYRRLKYKAAQWPLTYVPPVPDPHFSRGSAYAVSGTVEKTVQSSSVTDQRNQSDAWDRSVEEGSR